MKKRFLLIVMALLMALTACAQGEGAGFTPRLVKRVTEYDADFDTGAWTPVRTWDYTYENGYPVSIDLHEIDMDQHIITTLAYVFEDGLPVERKMYNASGELLLTVEYSGGRGYNVMEESENRRNLLFYQYGNGDEYFTLVLRDDRSHDPEDTESVNDYSEEVDAISVTTQNGLLVKTVNTGMYANWSDREEKEWLRFSGTYTAEYDEDGIASLASAVHREGPSGIEYRYEVTRADDGLVAEGISYVPEQDGSWYSLARYTFEYSELDTTPARYAQMINSYLMGSESSYYNYNWY